MNSPKNETATADLQASVRASGGGIVKPLLAGLAVATALGLTLLTWALSLMFMLGLFFFMLFGLLIGATMFRFGASSRPISKGKVVAITGIVALVCWTLAVAKEAIDYPNDFVESAIKKMYLPPGPNAGEKLEQELRSFITEYLKTNYPPGGALGYLRLAASGGAIVIDLPNQPKPVRMSPRVAAWVWWTRVVLSLVLLYITIHSITSDLTKTPEEASRKHPSSPDAPSPEAG